MKNSHNANALFKIIRFCRDLNIEIVFIERFITTESHYTIKRITKKNDVRALFSITSSARRLITEHDKECKRIAWEICHELGHYLAASPRRRLRKDYGIPSGKKGRTFYWNNDDTKAEFVSQKLMNHFKLYRGGTTKNKKHCRYQDAVDWYKNIGFDLTGEFINHPEKFRIK